MNETFFSKTYYVRKLNPADANQILELCSANHLYYDYCPPTPTKESVKSDLTELPPNKTSEDKYFVGYYSEDKLVAVLDLIDGYPEKEIAFIGFFMTDVHTQGRGTGSAIISDLLEYLNTIGFESVRLAWVKGNPQAEHFWKKNGFVPLKETSSNAAEHVILAERKL